MKTSNTSFKFCFHAFRTVPSLLSYHIYVGIKDLFIYLNVTITERKNDRKRKRERNIFAGLLLRWLQLPGLGQVKARGQELPPSVSPVSRGPNPWAIFCCFPRHINREWVESGTARTQSWTHLGCQHCGITGNATKLAPFVLVL